MVETNRAEELSDKNWIRLTLDQRCETYPVDTIHSKITAKMSEINTSFEIFALEDLRLFIRSIQNHADDFAMAKIFIRSDKETIFCSQI